MNQETYITKSDLKSFEKSLTTSLTTSLTASFTGSFTTSMTQMFDIFAEMILSKMVTKDEFNEFKVNTENHFYQIDTKLRDHDKRFDRIDNKLNAHQRLFKNLDDRSTKLEVHIGSRKSV